MPCFVDSHADLDTYAHEVGHALGIHINLTEVTMDETDPHTGQKRTVRGHHDVGPWPPEFAPDEIGLMGVHNNAGITYTTWLRQEDWDKANHTAGILYLTPP